MNRLQFWCGIFARMAALLVALTLAPARAAEEPDLIFKRSTVFKWLTPNDKLATYGLDDPEVEGVACHFTVPEKGWPQRLDRRGRGSIGHLACLPANWTDPHQGQVRAGRGRIP
jgi:CreA protein